jgi:hypothetical protein
MHLGGLLLANCLAVTYIILFYIYGYNNMDTTMDSCKDIYILPKTSAIGSVGIMALFLGFQVFGLVLGLLLECCACSCRRLRYRQFRMQLMDSNSVGFNTGESLRCIKPFLGIMSTFGILSFLWSVIVTIIVPTRCAGDLWGLINIGGASTLFLVGSIVYISKRY